MTHAQEEAIERAAQELRRTAQSICECNAVHSDDDPEPDWSSDPGAKVEHDRLLALAAELERAIESRSMNRSGFRDGLKCSAEFIASFKADYPVASWLSEALLFKFNQSDKIGEKPPVSSMGRGQEEVLRALKDLVALIDNTGLVHSDCFIYADSNCEKAHKAAVAAIAKAEPLPPPPKTETKQDA